jgi:hypothetical protein
LGLVSSSSAVTVFSFSWVVTCINKWVNA